MKPVLDPARSWPFPDAPTTSNGMVHVGCGGVVAEDWKKTYDYEGKKYPAHRCLSCGVEILGDAEIEYPGKRSE